MAEEESKHGSGSTSSKEGHDNESGSTGPHMSNEAGNKSLISLTIKTLDSQNHKIEGADEDSTIKEFKIKIADTVGIAAERQRLIYCGRVLNDEKKLKEYSLDGKVVHLVQRPPPSNSAGPDRLAASEARARSRGPSPSRGGRHQHHIHVHGPINTHVNVGQPSMLVRLNLARSMLQRANGVIDRLENPNSARDASTSGPSTTSTTSTNQSHTSPRAEPESSSETATTTSTRSSSANERASSTNGRRGIQILAAASGNHVMMEEGPFAGMPPGLARAIQSAVTDAIQSTHNMGPTSNESETTSEDGTTTRTVAMSFQVVDGQLIPTSNRQEPSVEIPARRNSSHNGSNSSESATMNNRSHSSNSREPNRTGTTSTSPPLAVDHPPPRMMAEVMAEYRRTERRLDTHWDRLDTMLRDDPSFENENDRNQHQTLFRSVTEAMHFLSHAQHAMSDAMLNLDTTPPRQLRARPFMIAPMVQSAVVQNLPIAIQVPSRGGTSGRNSRDATTSTSPAASTPMTTEVNTAAAAAEPMETSESSSDGENVPPASSGVENGVMQQLDAALASAARVLGRNSSNSSTPTSGATTDQPSGNTGDDSSATADIEVSMEPIVVGIEMGPEITIDSRGRAANSSNRASRGESPVGTSTSFHIAAPGGGRAPSAGMIQNMIQAALSNMGAVANVSVEEITPTSSPPSTGANTSSSSNGAASTQPGQDSRARGNTQTQPTTSTRTRSTTQVINVPHGPMGPPMGFMGPSGFPGGPMGPVVPNHNFDMLLPCNSHHIPQNNMRRENRRMRQQSFQQQHRHRSSSVPPRDPNPTERTGGTSDEGRTSGGIPPGQEGTRTQDRRPATSARGSPLQSPRRMQQTATLPGGGSVTVDFETNFDFGSFFGRTPPPPIQRANNARRNASNQGQSTGTTSNSTSQRDPDGTAELEPSLNNLINVLRQGGGNHRADQPHSNANNPVADVVRQAMSDDGMVNVIQGIVGQVMGAMGVPPPQGGATDQPSTISQFLESMPDYSYTEGEDIVTDFLMSLARVLTFRDLIGIVSGSGDAGLSPTSREAIGRLQDPMQNFMRRRMFNDGYVTAGATGTPETPNSAAIEASIIRLLDDSFSPHFESCAELANVRDNIDFAETLHNFLTIRLTEIAVDCIWNTELTSYQFGTQYYDNGLNFLADLTRLCLRCFSDGQSSIERVVQNRLSGISEDVGSTVSQWTMSAAIGHLRNYVAGVSEERSESVFNQFVVRPGASIERRAARQHRIELRRQRIATSIIGDPVDIEIANATNGTDVSDQQDEDETFETPRSSPEVMITDNLSPERSSNAEMDVDDRPKHETKNESVHLNKPIVNPPSVHAPEQNNTELAFPPELLPRMPDMVVGREPWHRQVPSDWVPIITRDIQGQQHVAPQMPFSDAYLTTQPAKKRRLAESKKPEGSIEKVISETLKDAIKASGVQTKSTTQGASAVSNSISGNTGIAVEVAKDEGVQAAVRNDTRGAIKRRLQQDPDFKPERFPDSSDFVSKK